MRVLPRAAIVAAIAACLAWPAAAVPIIYVASLDGATEDPPVPTLGTGSARVTIDTEANTLRVEVSFADLTGVTILAHIHGPTANPFAGNATVMTTTPTFPGFPEGVTSGSYDQTFDTTLPGTYRPGFITEQGGTVEAAEMALAAALADGKAYLNIHTNFSPAGEIRGFLAPIPLPAGLPLLLGGMAALAWAARRHAV